MILSSFIVRVIILLALLKQRLEAFYNYHRINHGLTQMRLAEEEQEENIKEMERIKKWFMNTEKILREKNMTFKDLENIAKKRKQKLDKAT